MVKFLNFQIFELQALWRMQTKRISSSSPYKWNKRILVKKLKTLTAWKVSGLL